MTNEAQLLSALVSGAQVKPDFQPQNNKQAYLAYLNGLSIQLPEPRTSEEALLYNLCAKGLSVGGGNGGGSLKINNAAYSFTRATDSTKRMNFSRWCRVQLICRICLLRVVLPRLI